MAQWRRTQKGLAVRRLLQRNIESGEFLFTGGSQSVLQLATLHEQAQLPAGWNARTPNFLPRRHAQLYHFTGPGIKPWMMLRKQGKVCSRIHGRRLKQGGHPLHAWVHDSGVREQVHDAYSAWKQAAEALQGRCSAELREHVGARKLREFCMSV